VLEWVGRVSLPGRLVKFSITKRTIDAMLFAVRKIGAVNRTNAVAIAYRRIINVYNAHATKTMSQIAISQVDNYTRYGCLRSCLTSCHATDAKRLLDVMAYHSTQTRWILSNTRKINCLRAGDPADSVFTSQGESKYVISKLEEAVVAIRDRRFCAGR